MYIVAIGIATGCVYALVALGYSLVYRTTGVVNFAQGSFVMVGGMSAYWFLDTLRVPYPIALLGGVVFAALVGFILWMLVVLPLWQRRAAPYVVILATLVFFSLVQDGFLHWLGTNPVTLPEWIPGFKIMLGGAGVAGQYLWVALATVVLIVGFVAFLRFSPLGRQMRASAVNRDVSQLLGISPRRIGMLALTSTAAIGGLGGVLITPAQYTSFDVGLTYGIYGFVAAVLGGFGSMWGALVGGIIIGLIQVLTGRYISTAYETFIAFAVLLVLLAFRPKGIFGGNWEES